MPRTEEEVLHAAEQLLVRDCMSGQGFQYWPEPYDPAAELKRFPYVVDDVSWARAHGYGRDIRQRLDDAAASNPNQAYFAGLSDQQKVGARVALNGDQAHSWLEAKPPMGGTLRHSDNGCTVEAWQRLYGDAAAWFRASSVVTNLDGMQVGRVIRDARYQAKVKSWRRCMKTRGVTADNPGELRNTRLSYRGSDAQERDRHAAVNEAECAHMSGLAKTAHHLDEWYSAALRRQYRSDYEAVERLQEAALPTARDLVSKQ